MNTLQKALTESIAVLLVGLAIVGGLLFTFSQNTGGF